MASISSLAPFSQKFLFISKSGDQENRLLSFVIDGNLNWHWKNVWESALEKKFSHGRDAQNTDRAGLFSLSGNSIVAKQPKWDLNDVSDKASISVEDGWGASQDNGSKEAPPVKGGIAHSPDWHNELLACYRSAHFYDGKEYGIHISKAGALAAATRVHERCPGQNINVVLLSVVFFLFAHELCHAWIEDICSLTDFIEGGTKDIKERRYHRAQQHCNGYILMEEALCNTAAFAWLRHFLSTGAGDHLNGNDKFSANKILNAFKGWLEDQPNGYKDFVVLPEIPVDSNKFIINMMRLIVEIYDSAKELNFWKYVSTAATQATHSSCSADNKPTEKQPAWKDYISHAATEAIGLFFGCDVKPDASLGERRRSHMDALWVGEVPVYLKD